MAPPPAGLSYEEWLEKNPVPEKWQRRLERDEEELRARDLLAAPAKQGPGVVGVTQGKSWATPGGSAKAASLPNAKAGPDRRVSAYHFPAKLKGKPKT